MTLVDTKKMFENANKNRYAVGAFNVDNLDGMQAVVDAAHQTQSPVIIAFTERSFYYFRPEYIKSAIKTACEHTNVPIALHLDHGKSFEVCKQAIECGFTSVMIDASRFDLNKNIEITKKVVDFAHDKGVVVEGELGAICGVEDDVVVEDKYGKFTHPEDAYQYVTKSQVDSLAIAIGTAHGAFKFKPNQVPQLRFDILEEVEKLLPDFPLVLHGASSVPKAVVDIFNKYGGQIQQASGVPEEMLKKVLHTAVCKINICSDLRMSFLAEFRRVFVEKPKSIDIRDFVVPAREAVKDLVVDKIENLLMSAGHAND